jgi:hypothetical protein
MIHANGETPAARAVPIRSNAAHAREGSQCPRCEPLRTWPYSPSAARWRYTDEGVTSAQVVERPGEAGALHGGLAGAGLLDVDPRFAERPAMCCLTSLSW